MVDVKKAHDQRGFCRLVPSAGGFIRTSLTVSNTLGYVKTFYSRYPNDKKPRYLLRAILANSPWQALHILFRDQRLILRGVRRYSAAL